MFAATATSWVPWYVVRSDDKRRTRLNIMAHILWHVPYDALPREKIKLPDRQKVHGYQEPDFPYKYIPEMAWPAPGLAASDRPKARTGDLRSERSDYPVAGQGACSPAEPVTLATAASDPACRAPIQGAIHAHPA